MKVSSEIPNHRQEAKNEIVQLYRFAEFGRLASGLFHDLVIPLNVISLNLEELHRHHQYTKDPRLRTKKNLLKRALHSTKQMESYIKAARKHIQNEEDIRLFSLTKETKEIIQMLHYKSQEMHVKIICDFESDIKMYGNPIKYDQIISNVIANAIDSYQGMMSYSPRTIHVNLEKIHNKVSILITDNGCGIAKKNLSKIFDALFTTKHKDSGMGIGLLITREIVEHNFNGKVTVRSEVNKGTIFHIKFPLNGYLK